VYNLIDYSGLLQTRQGLHKALEKPEVLIKNSNAFIHDTASRISIPNLIGDIDISVALVKHPTRTVKIKQLTDDISSHQLKEALSFCRSGINVFLGASSSNAYVEFEVSLLPFWRIIYEASSEFTLILCSHQQLPFGMPVEYFFSVDLFFIYYYY